jgi:tRNA threonylcarbamoyladenosine biosynthesis protein TsaB
LAWAGNVPLIGVSTLDVLAAGCPVGPTTICPLISARKDRVYAAQYRKGDRNNWEKEMEPGSFSIDRLIQAIDGPTIFFGPAVATWASELALGLGPSFVRGDESLDRPRARILAQAGWERLTGGDQGDPALVTPIYVRPPDIRPAKNILAV